jgi:hypothetical protein
VWPPSCVIGAHPRRQIGQIPATESVSV